MTTNLGELMNNKTKVAIGVMAWLIVDLTLTNARNRRKADKNYRIAVETGQAFKQAADLANFYADIINKRQIPLDDYELIVMNNLTQ
jgi:hypothetical protein